MIYAPVLITTLNRHSHFLRLMRSLKNNEWANYTDVYVALDFPPSEKYKEGWRIIKDYLENDDFSIFKSFHVIYREHNYGFEGNADDLLAQLYEKYDRFIILEDDLELSPNYLEFMDRCLDMFQDNAEVVAVTGYCYPLPWNVSEKATCMKQNFNAAAWGRGFWKYKRQQYYEYIFSGTMLKDVDRIIKNKDYKQMIDASMREYIPAAVSPSKRFHKFMYFPCDISMRAYLVVKGSYIISPVVSKVRNSGFDGSGVYCQDIKVADGLTAGTYNYSEQPIDEQTSFELILDDSNNLRNNRDMLNLFDKRTHKQMIFTKLFLWIITHCGVQVAKCLAVLLFPWEILERVLYKIHLWK